MLNPQKAVRRVLEKKTRPTLRQYKECGRNMFFVDATKLFKFTIKVCLSEIIGIYLVRHRTTFYGPALFGSTRSTVKKFAQRSLNVSIAFK